MLLLIYAVYNYKCVHHHANSCEAFMGFLTCAMIVVHAVHTRSRVRHRMNL